MNFFSSIFLSYLFHSRVEYLWRFLPLVPYDSEIGAFNSMHRTTCRKKLRKIILFMKSYQSSGALPADLFLPLLTPLCA